MILKKIIKMFKIFFMLFNYIHFLNMTKENKLIIKNITGGFKESIKVFSYTIYKNFDSYKQYQSLHHTLDDITALLKSKEMYCLLVYNFDHKLIAYLIGEIIKIDNGNMVFFINYLYVSEKYRNMGIGSKLLDIIIKKVKHWKIDDIMLLCDSMNDSLNGFFGNRHFYVNTTYAQNERFEILSYKK